MEKDIVTLINGLRGKHTKLALVRLERDGLLTPRIRKIVLDQMNDLVRDILETLGYGEKE